MVYAVIVAIIDILQCPDQRQLGCSILSNCQWIPLGNEVG